MSILDILLDYISTHKATLKPRSSVLVACSGGPDSMGLAWGLKAISASLPLTFHLGHVNHALRNKDSELDEKLVRQAAKNLGWPFHSVRRAIPKNQPGNLEEKARNARYQALANMARKSGCQVILTAHTLDDQVETVLLNMGRGTGLDGLGGMKPLRAFGSLYLGRPFLDTSKKEIFQYIRQFHIPYRIDRTNMNPKWARNWLRLSLVPQLETRFQGFRLNVSRLAKIIRDEQDFWRVYLDRAVRAVTVDFRGDRLVDLDRLLRYPSAVQRRIVRRLVAEDLLTFDAVERLRRWMGSPPSGGRQFQLKCGWVVERLSKSKGAPKAGMFWFHRIHIKRREPARHRGVKSFVEK